MRDYGHQSVGGSSDLQSVPQLTRAVASVVGIVAMVMGIVFASRLFGLILGALREPAGLEELLENWVTVVGGETLNVVIGGVPFPFARVLALAVFGGGVSILAWIAMGLIGVGSKALQSVLSEREAIKQILLDAFGPSGKPNAHRSKTDQPQA